MTHAERIRDEFAKFMAAVSDVPLSDVETVIEEELTLLETAGVPWAPSPKEQSSSIRDIELPPYLHGIKLPILAENNADNG